MSKLDLKEPKEATSALAHFLDAILFRVGGGLVLYHEIFGGHPVRIPALVTGFCLFFMPDWLRGKSSVVLSIIQRLLGGKSE